jgi:hypothetical protein
MYFLYGNRVIIYVLVKEIIIVWDFMMNTMVSWFVGYGSNLSNRVCYVSLLPLQATDSPFIFRKVFRATETAIMIIRVDYFRRPSALIFQIPPLVPQPPLFGTEEGLLEVAPIRTFEGFGVTAVGFPMLNYWYNGDLSSSTLLRLG